VNGFSGAATVHRATAGDASFTYAEAGIGPALVLLHGIGSAARSWAHQLAGLSDEFRVIAWDAPGYGGSTPVTPERPDASDYAAALARLLDALKVEHLHLVGHSLGTVTALRFARQHTERVRSLTLASLSSGHAQLRPEDQKRLRDARLADLDTLGPKGMAQKRAPRLLSPAAPLLRSRQSPRRCR
jgi:Predicted hydrolases or acyltransferases (alpha/beta hydrolase superfamily)